MIGVALVVLVVDVIVTVALWRASRRRQALARGRALYPFAGQAPRHRLDRVGR